MSNQEKIKEIFDRWFSEAPTDDDIAQLRKFSDSPEFPDLLSSELKDQWNKIGPHPEFTVQRSREIGKTIFNVSSDNGRTLPQVHRIHFLKTAWFKYAAAILLIFGVGAYLYTTQQRKGPVSSAEVVTKADNNDIAPGTNKAVLTLSDGSTIILDSAANGQIAIQGNSNIIKKDGQIVYDYERGSISPAGGSGREAAEGGLPSYNTMSTPRGGQYQLTLPDGSQVWLNAASSITYHTAFIGKERIVKISGEVYFEVKKNAVQPFIVQTPTDNIQVLGTNFNVNAYADERSMKTSLLEGSVKVGGAILKPGQAYTNGKVVTTNIEEDVAWKNGYFNFNNADLPTVMRQLERWYNITVKYPAEIPKYLFKGKLDRGLSLREALEILHDQGIEYSLKKRTLIISP